jgi:hypothetical protein
MKGQFKRTAQKGVKKSAFRLFFLNLGRLILDVAKLCFGSLVLGIVRKGQIPQTTLLTIGIITSAACALGGIILVTACEEK